MFVNELTWSVLPFFWYIGKPSFCPLHTCRFLLFPLGTKSCTRLCLTLDICCWTLKRGNRWEERSALSGLLNEQKWAALWFLSPFTVQVFDQYVKTRAEEERKEKKNKLMQAKDDFRKMMEDAKLHNRCVVCFSKAFSTLHTGIVWPPEILPLMPIFLSPIRTTFSEFAAKHSKDPRFKAIEKMKDREAMFTEIMTALRKKDKEESKNKVEKVCHRLPTTILKCPLESTGCW